ncbi:hypothetical protein [Oscillibacter sp. ER4]|uniref:hypothetical protein n=1 Tax=Oscillibacter sp. ER4 TaxID=1519439 RepID=UPI00051AC807|nr:hypothetical protein [Oscillibacter sp. ER4]
MAYTYDDFQKAASGSNVNFSQYDLDLAKKYPEFGMSVLDLKKQYAGATTAEQRALINAKANQLRSSYGNYTAGADGSQYVSDGKYAPKIDETLDKIGSFKPFTYDSAPSYENRFQQKQQELLDAALKRDPFSWSKETDPQYSSYKKTYLREGERATADALAKASAASGGRPSSFAVNAATQAGDYYATKLSDVIPTLYQQAYERYLKDYQMKLSDLNAVNQQEQLDYAKYLDRLNQFNTDRNFDYNNYLGEYGRLQDYLGGLQGQDNTEYNRYLGVLDEIREKQQQDQELSRSQVDAMLQAGVSPSAGLIGKSGYESEYVKALENYYKQQAAQAAAKTSGRSGGTTRRSGGNDGGNESSMKLSTAKDMAKQGIFSAEVRQAFYDAGYNDEYLKNAYGYNPNHAWMYDGDYNGAYFNAAMSSLRTMLEQGKTDNAIGGIQSFWDKLSNEQKQKVRALVESYGGSISG